MRAQRLSFLVLLATSRVACDADPTLTRVATAAELDAMNAWSRAAVAHLESSSECPICRHSVADGFTPRPVSDRAQRENVRVRCTCGAPPPAAAPPATTTPPASSAAGASAHSVAPATLIELGQSTPPRTLQSAARDPHIAAAF